MSGQFEEIREQLAHDARSDISIGRSVIEALLAVTEAAEGYRSAVAGVDDHCISDGDWSNAVNEAEKTLFATLAGLEGKTSLPDHPPPDWEDDQCAGWDAHSHYLDDIETDYVWNGKEWVLP